MDKDYDLFVQRMGSFDMDVTEIPRKEESLTHFIKITEDNHELMHYGKLGMKWGHRKTQYSSAELSARKKAKVSKAYVKEMEKSMDSLVKRDLGFQINAHNKAADEWNNGKLAKFNKKHDPNDPDYESKREKAFTDDSFQHLTKMRIDHIEKDVHYQKAQALVKKYDMMNYDDVVKKNAKDLVELKSLMSTYKKNQ